MIMLDVSLKRLGQAAVNDRFSCRDLRRGTALPQIGLYDAYRRGTNGDSPAPYDSVMNWFNMSVTNLDIARVIAYVEGGGMQVYP